MTNSSLRHHATLTVVALGALLFGATVACGDDDSSQVFTRTVTATSPTAQQQVAGAKTGSATTPIPQTYTVKDGDTLFDIAQRYKTTVIVLIELNSLDNGNQIQVGQVLKLPQ